MSVNPVEATGGEAGAEIGRQRGAGTAFLALIGVGVVGTLLWWVVLALMAIQVLS